MALLSTFLSAVKQVRYGMSIVNYDLEITDQTITWIKEFRNEYSVFMICAITSCSI